MSKNKIKLFGGIIIILSLFLLPKVTNAWIEVRNANGTINSPSNPAAPGSTVYVNYCVMLNAFGEDAYQSTVFQVDGERLAAPDEALGYSPCLQFGPSGQGRTSAPIGPSANARYNFTAGSHTLTIWAIPYVSTYADKQREASTIYVGAIRTSDFTVNGKSSLVATFDTSLDFTGSQRGNTSCYLNLKDQNGNNIGPYKGNGRSGVAFGGNNPDGTTQLTFTAQDGTFRSSDYSSYPYGTYIFELVCDDGSGANLLTKTVSVNFNSPATINVSTSCGVGSWVLNPGNYQGSGGNGQYTNVQSNTTYTVSYTPPPAYDYIGTTNSDGGGSSMYVPAGSTKSFTIDCRLRNNLSVDLKINGQDSVTLSSGQSGTLTWASAGATSCTGTNFNTSNATNNTTGVSTGALSGSQVYTINCLDSSGGSVSDTATVTVGAPPCAVAYFTASPASLNPGGSTVLSYASNGNCTSGTLNGGPWNNTSLPASGYSAQGNTSNTGALNADTAFTYRVCNGAQCDSRPLIVPVNNCQAASTVELGCPSGYSGSHTQTTTYSGASCSPSTSDNNQCVPASCTPSTSCSAQGISCGSIANGCPGGETCGAACTCTTAPSTAPTLSGSTSSQCGGKAQLNWTSSSCATGYKIYRSGTYITTVTGTSYTDEGLEPSTGYGYKIRATNNYGESPDSNQVGVTTSAACTEANQTPSIFGSTNAQCGGNLDIWWTSVSGATSYNFYRSGTLIGTYPASQTTYEERWLTPGTGFGYKVGAVVAGVEYMSPQIGVVTSRSCRITVNNNTTGSWTISPGNLVGSGSTYKDISPADSGTTYTISPASVSGYNFPPTITNNITGSGSSISLWPGSDAIFNLNYGAAAASFNYSLTNSGDITVTKGGTNQYGSNTITKVLASGSSQGVNLSVSGLPSGVSVYSISNQGCSPTCSSALTLVVLSSATAGTYPITVTGDAVSGGRTTSFNLIVKNSSAVNVTCSAALSSAPGTPITSAKIGEAVIWTAAANGGSGSGYQYSWSGTALPQTGSKGPGTNQYTIIYSTLGQKTMRSQVVDSLGNSGLCSDSTITITFNPIIKEF